MEKIEYTLTEFHGPNSLCRGTIADLILDAFLVARCGLIPPFRVVAALFRSGGSRGGMSPGCIWQPFELREDEYLQAVERLEKFTPEDLKGRHRNPQIIGEIRPDYDAPDTEDFQEWAQSLVHRGYLPGDPFRQVKR